VSDPSRLRPPTHDAPDRATAPDGTRRALRPFAEEICRRYHREFPDDERRYGKASVAWCLHDNQHILNWAFAAPTGMVDLSAEVRWLAGVLDARGFPVAQLRRDLEIAADVLGEEPGLEPIAQRLRTTAAEIADGPRTAPD